jgi:hypothetical protein
LGTPPPVPTGVLLHIVVFRVKAGGQDLIWP